MGGGLLRYSGLASIMAPPSDEAVTASLPGFGALPSPLATVRTRWGFAFTGVGAGGVGTLGGSGGGTGGGGVGGTGGATGTTMSSGCGGSGGSGSSGSGMG